MDVACRAWNKSPHLNRINTILSQSGNKVSAETFKQKRQTPLTIRGMDSNEEDNIEPWLSTFMYQTIKSIQAILSLCCHFVVWLRYEEATGTSSTQTTIRWKNVKDVKQRWRVWMHHRALIFVTSWISQESQNLINLFNFSRVKTTHLLYPKSAKVCSWIFKTTHSLTSMLQLQG